MMSFSHVQYIPYDWYIEKAASGMLKACMIMRAFMQR